MQDYKSLCAAVTNCANLANTFTTDPVKALHFAILVKTECQSALRSKN